MYTSKLPFSAYIHHYSPSRDSCILIYFIWSKYNLRRRLEKQSRPSFSLRDSSGLNFTRARVSLALLVVYTNPDLMELFHKIYQNCRGLRILRSTIEPANSHSQFFLSVALLLLSFFLQFLLKSGKGKRLVEEYDKYENTPLHVAAKKGYVRIVQVSSNSRVSLKAGTGPEHPPSPRRARSLREHP